MNQHQLCIEYISAGESRPSCICGSAQGVDDGRPELSWFIGHCAQPAKGDDA